MHINIDLLMNHKPIKVLDIRLDLKDLQHNLRHHMEVQCQLMLAKILMMKTQNHKDRSTKIKVTLVNCKTYQTFYS